MIIKLQAYGRSLASVIPILLVSLAFVAAGSVAQPAHAAQHKKYSDTILELKFNDDSDIQAKGNTFVGTGADDVNAILGKAKIQSSKQLFAKDKKELNKQYRTLKKQGKSVADLSQYYKVRLAVGADIDAVSKQLASLPVVDHAYAQPLPVATPATPS